MKYFFTTLKDLNEKKYIIKFIEEVRDELICFVNKNNQIKVFSSICPHFGGELFYDNKINALRCKWHDWKFCTTNGRCLSYPIKSKLNPYDFEVIPKKLNKYKSHIDNNDIYIYLNGHE